MPKLHPMTGRAACGTAGGKVSYASKLGEQFVLTDGGCTFWLNADEIAYLGPASGSWGGTPGATVPQKINIHTRERTILDTREASFLAAGGGRWQAGQAGNGNSFGSCGEFPLGTISRAMTDGRGACSSDGTIALVDSYQASRNGFRLARSNGNITDRIADGWDAYGLTVIDSQRAIWPYPDRWGVYGIYPFPFWLKGSSRACWCEVGGVAYLVHELAGVGLVARRADSNRGCILVEGDRFYHYDAIAWQNGSGSCIRIAWVTTDGEPPGSLVIKDWDCQSGLVDLIRPDPPPPPPPLSFGPVSDPLPHDGNVFDLLKFVLGDQTAWPRKGPTHPMNQVAGPEGIFYFVKFGNPNAVEVWGYDIHWLYQLTDASNDQADRLTDPRFFPRYMPIGEEHAFVSGPHERIFYNRVTCAEIRREPVGRRMWVNAIYPRFDCGPDFGIRTVMEIAYDPTAGIHGPTRAIELGWYARGIGSLRWGSYRSDLLYPPGATHARFSETARLFPFSDFYLLGGANTQPKLGGCVPLIVPNAPPWKPKPIPTPDPKPFKPAITLEKLMTPKPVLLQIGDFFAKIDRSNPGPNSSVPWPGWFPIRFTRDGNDPDCRFELSQPTGSSKLKAQDPVTRGLFTADFTEFGGSVCQGFFLSPTDEFGAYQQLSGWQLGSSGPKIVVVQYPEPRLGKCSPSLTVVEL